ncbi:DUF2891 domain-containing protein [Campylobacter sp. 2457A]|uniref:DUF2891 domain-containing protein n=1 Tax=Campylobacter sp. 2457A TaxID=2735784 RepID=UPI00301C4FBC|nr:DUF2891 domain-containing protein [Campylobacter sp. 2457A]
MEEFIKQFSAIALENIFKELPNKITHSFNDLDDVKIPKQMYPIFYGSYDWHSSVHSHWLLVKILRNFANFAPVDEITKALNSQFSKEKAEGELKYLENPAHKGFERPYGWGWFLKLALELNLLAKENQDAKIWAKNLDKIADFFVKEFKEFLPKMDYPIRVGTHFNSSFALYFALEFARFKNDQELEQYIIQSARRWFLNDENMQTLEPCGDEFLSPVLMEAVLLSAVLPEDEFKIFFKKYLPKLNEKKPETLFNPVRVSDRTDGKIAHLDGLNLSRSWCLKILSNFCDEDLKNILRKNATDHFNEAIAHIEEDYLGSHWLGSFALLALDVKLK